MMMLKLCGYVIHNLQAFCSQSVWKWHLLMNACRLAPRIQETYLWICVDFRDHLHHGCHRHRHRRARQRGPKSLETDSIDPSDGSCIKWMSRGGKSVDYCRRKATPSRIEYTKSCHYIIPFTIHYIISNLHSSLPFPLFSLCLPTSILSRLLPH